LQPPLLDVLSLLQPARQPAIWSGYGTFSTFKLIFYFDRIYWIFWIIFLYLKFPEEILNEQSATPKRETFAKRPEGALVLSYAIKLLITAHIYYGHQSSTKSLTYHFLQQAPDNPLVRNRGR
jgi:hypothetical protein